MSVSKWAWTEECDGRICVGDCDLCSYEEESEEEDETLMRYGADAYFNIGGFKE